MKSQAGMNMFERQTKKDNKVLTDTEIIEGLQDNDKKIENLFYLSCRSYFVERRSGIFVFEQNGAREPQDIFQESFLKLWQEIQSRRIFIHNNYAWRIDKNGVGRKMSASLKTYLMAIAKYKNYENIREEEIYADEPTTFTEIESDESDEDFRNWIVTQCVNNLPDRCKDILTLFYYENKSLDEILSIRKESRSKDGLKTGKSKCIKTLRERISKEFEHYNLNIISHV